MHRRLLLALAALPCAPARASVLERPLIAAAASLQPALEEAAALITAQTLPCAPARASVLERPLIAAAASLQPALEEAAALITAQTGIAPRFAYGASGNLARQIAQGAPFEMLLAADEISIQKLAEAGHTRDAGHVFARGRLALFAPRGSALDPAGGLEALRPLLAAGRVQRFAIANPEIAPYGRAAEQALRRLDLWEALRPHLVFGTSIAQAAQFATTEGAIGGLLTKRGSEAALRLQAWLLSPQAAAVFARHGLQAP